MARSLIYAMYNQGRRSVLRQREEILKHAGKALLAERIREMETSVFLSQKVGIIGPADGIGSVAADRIGVGKLRKVDFL